MELLDHKKLNQDVAYFANVVRWVVGSHGKTGFGARTAPVSYMGTIYVICDCSTPSGWRN